MQTLCILNTCTSTYTQENFDTVVMFPAQLTEMVAFNNLHCLICMDIKLCLADKELHINLWQHLLSTGSNVNNSLQFKILPARNSL